MKVLFIGNSHTYTHYVPLRTAAFSMAMGHPLEATMLTQGGMGLDWHLQQHQTRYNLVYGGYDAVILQHLAHPFPGREALLKAGKALAEIVPANTKRYVYMTWSEKNNPQGQDAMCEACEALAREIGAEVCPVGRIWQQVRSAHPEMELYGDDGEHSSVLGASLAASVIGRTLLGMEVTAEICLEEAQQLAQFPEDPRLSMHTI